jgi:hypothetical protein
MRILLLLLALSFFASPLFAAITVDANGVTATVTPGADAAFFYVSLASNGSFLVVGRGGAIMHDSDHDGLVRYEWPSMPSTFWAVTDMSNGHVDVGGPLQGATNEVPVPPALVQQGRDGLISRISVYRMPSPRVAWIRPGVGAWLADPADGATNDDDGLINNRASIAASKTQPFLGSTAALPSLRSGDVIVTFGAVTYHYFVAHVDLTPKSGAGFFTASADPARMFEGMAIPLVITRQDGSSGAATVTYATTGAGAGTRYVPTSGSLNFASGETEKTILIPTIDNATYDAEALISVSLTATGAPVECSPVSIPLHDDDPPPQVVVPDVTVLEGGDGVHLITLYARLVGETSVPASFAWSVAGGSASRLTLQPHETKALTFFWPGDTVPGDDLVLPIAFSAPFNCVMARPFATVTILDDDRPSLTLENASVREGDSGAATVNVPILLSVAAATPASVRFHTVDRTALSGKDYVAASGTITFAPGETKASIALQVLGNDIAESDRTFAVVLSNASGARIVNGEGTVTITDDDVAVIDVDDGSGKEGNEGVTPLSIVVRLSRPSQQPISVTLSTADGTATAGNDYVAIDTTVTFAPGETLRTVPIDILGDTLAEPDETFKIVLRDAGAPLARESATMTIVNDDTAPPPRRRAAGR